jgi:EF-hand domain pair
MGCGSSKTGPQTAKEQDDLVCVASHIAAVSYAHSPPPPQLNELRVKFATFDKDNSGSIDRAEARQLIEDALGEGEGLTDAELDKALQEMDPNNSGAWVFFMHGAVLLLLPVSPQPALVVVWWYTACVHGSTHTNTLSRVV